MFNNFILIINENVLNIGISNNSVNINVIVIFDINVSINIIICNLMKSIPIVK